MLDLGFQVLVMGVQSMCNQRYKVLRHQGNIEFYDLQEDPYEQINLLKGELTPAERTEYESLSQQVADLRSSE